MLREVSEYGYVLGAPVKHSQIDPTTNPTVLLKQLSATTFDPTDPEIRPAGWAELKLKRIRAKESFEGLMGASLEAVKDKAVVKEKEVCTVYMIHIFHITYRYTYNVHCLVGGALDDRRCDEALRF